MCNSSKKYQLILFTSHLLPIPKLPWFSRWLDIPRRNPITCNALPCLLTLPSIRILQDLAYFFINLIPQTLQIPPKERRRRPLLLPTAIDIGQPPYPNNLPLGLRPDVRFGFLPSLLIIRRPNGTGKADRTIIPPAIAEGHCALPSLHVAAITAGPYGEEFDEGEGGGVAVGGTVAIV